MLLYWAVESALHVLQIIKRRYSLVVDYCSVHTAWSAASIVTTHNSVELHCKEGEKGHVRDEIVPFQTHWSNFHHRFIHDMKTSVGLHPFHQKRGCDYLYLLREERTHYDT